MNKVAIITGGDSGIGRDVAVGFVKEGAKVAIVYYKGMPSRLNARRKIMTKINKVINSEDENVELPSKLFNEIAPKYTMGNWKKTEALREITSTNVATYYDKYDWLQNKLDFENNI